MNKQYYAALDETLYSTRLPNGLTVKVVPRPGFSKCLAYYVTDFGSVHTEFELDGQRVRSPEGVAHYLEHKLFELPQRDVTEEFASLGSHVNAFTSYDMTAYYVSCSAHTRENIRLLLEFVSTPYFPEESVLREQGIIDQEIGMNEDAPDSVIFEKLMEALYPIHPIHSPILGTRASIREITPQVLEENHRAFYAPENMILCVVGDVDPDMVVSLAREVLGDAPRTGAKKQHSWPETMSAAAPLTRCAMEVAMPTFLVGFKCEPLDKGEAAIREEIVADLAAEALFGESSELYLRLYEEGLIDSSFGGGFETVDGCAILSCGGDSNHPQQVRDALLEQAGKLRKTGLEEGAFTRMKRSALGRRIRDLDSFDSTCFRICAYHFSDFDYFRFPELYEHVTQEDVLAFLDRVVRPERCAISIVDPISQEETNYAS